MSSWVEQDLSNATGTTHSPDTWGHSNGLDFFAGFTDEDSGGRENVMVRHGIWVEI